MAIQNFNSKADFLLWAKEKIKEDKEFLYNENMPVYLLAKIKIKELVESTYTDYCNYYFSCGKPKNELKKVLHNLNRLESMRSNQLIDLEIFEKNINKVLDTEMLNYINSIPNIDIKDIEPHQYYIFLNAIEEIKFFQGSNNMKYKDLFSISKDKYDREIQLLIDSADKIAFCFDNDFIDHQIRIRLPLNPKVVISTMFFYLIRRGSHINREEIIDNFFKCLVSYFIDEKIDKKKIQKELHHKHFIEINSSYGIKNESSLGNYSHYFYEPSIKKNYNS